MLIYHSRNTKSNIDRKIQKDQCFDLSSYKRNCK